MNYESWLKGTRASYGDDPTEWSGTNPRCKLCEKDAENMDEYCEDHQRCIMCGENDDCDCKDYYSQRSPCCDARWDEDTMRCYDCKDCTDNAWDFEIRRLKDYDKFQRLKEKRESRKP